MATPVYLIGGTHYQSSRCQWWREGSPFRQFLAAHDFDVLGVIEWSGNVVIAPQIERDWYYGAENVIDALSCVPLEARNVIAHSHGGQLAILASQDVPIRRLLTIGTPNHCGIEYDGSMIERWRHCIDKKFDKWGVFGSFAGWALHWNRRMPATKAENVLMPGVRHGGLLEDPALCERWEHDGLIDFFRTEKR